MTVTQLDGVISNDLALNDAAKVLMTRSRRASRSLPLTIELLVLHSMDEKYASPGASITCTGRRGFTTDTRASFKLFDGVSTEIGI